MIIVLDYRSSRFASLKFSQFYREGKLEVDGIEKKEFGFGDFDSMISKRHMAFRSIHDFRRYVAAAVPASISISSAFYRYPDARPMEKKEWLGSELVFDLDASDLHLPCQERHGKSWVCPVCLDSVRRETIKLIEDFLVPDFAIPRSAMLVSFSGNRGYHIHIRDERLYPLDSQARAQITDYITGRGINLKVFFPSLGERGKRLVGPTPTDAGWGGKMANGIITALNSGEAALTSLGIERSSARKLLANRAAVILGITTGNWDKVEIPKKSEFWENVLVGLRVSQTSSIDKNVTSGIEHLIRLPGSIHPGTGLLAKPLGGKSLESFDPMKEALPFKKGAVKVSIENAPAFIMNGMEFGPYKDQKIELPTYAALYLMLKRVAVLA